MKKGIIVILNGVSSSGKTSLARVIQNRSPIPFYRLDIDDFILMSPEKFNDYENGDYSVQYAFASKFFYVVKLYSDLGFDLVVPCMIFKSSEALENYKSLLNGYPVLTVNIICPEDELQRRELARGNRKTGSSSEQLKLLETDFDNGLTVNNYTNTNEECADTIVRAILNMKRSGICVK